MARKKIFVDTLRENTIEQFWEMYTASQTAKGVSDITLRNYKQHLHSISKYLDIRLSIVDLSKNDLDTMVVQMRQSGMAINTVATYVRRMRAFLNWCNREGCLPVGLDRECDLHPLRLERAGLSGKEAEEIQPGHSRLSALKGKAD